MPRPALALVLLAVLLSACASTGPWTGAAPAGHARGPGMADLYAHPPVTTFGL